MNTLPRSTLLDNSEMRSARTECIHLDERSTRDEIERDLEILYSGVRQLENLWGREIGNMTNTVLTMDNREISMSFPSCILKMIT